MAEIPHEYLELIQDIRNSKKYRDLDLPEDFLLDILNHEAGRGMSGKALKDKFRTQLHNVIAPYLETLDYAREIDLWLNFQQTNPSLSELRTWAAGVLSKHASSRERLPHLSLLYQKIEDQIGIPESIMDLACALDPLNLLWTDWPKTIPYFAYDLNLPRVKFLNRFFPAVYPNAKAIQQDILINPPTEPTQAAFFFKEAHRFEKRKPGSNAYFFMSLPVDVIIVTLPATDLTGHHSLENYHGQLIQSAIQNHPWQLVEDRAGDELIFFIFKR